MTKNDHAKDSGEDGRSNRTVAEDAIAALRGFADDVYDDDHDPEELSDCMHKRATDLSNALEDSDE